MTATLRVVLDQLATPVDAEVATASRELARALVLTAPDDCEIEAIVPSTDAAAIDAAVPGLAEVHRTALGRRELAAAVQLGAPTGIGGGMIHSPSLFAPLVRHDRIHDHDQTVVTVWDLRPWEAAGELPRATVLWQRAMLKRAVKYADAVVVPTHAFADRLLELVPRLGTRVRVVAGAAPSGFAVPTDEIGRRRSLDLPEGFVLLSGGRAPSDALSAAFAAVASAGQDLPIVVLDAPEGEEPAIVELAAAHGIPERSLHLRGALPSPDRAAVLGAAVALVAPSRRTAFPWRVVEALALGVPVVAAGSPVHAEVVLDGGVLAGGLDAGSADDGTALGEGLAGVLGSAATAEKLAVLSADRGRAFSWREAADRVWQLHADL